jgi:aminoglycoside phosphotransferase (APT) family kinase protein
MKHIENGAIRLPLGDLSVWGPLPPGEEGAYQWGQLKPEVWSHFMSLPRACAVPKLMHDRDRMQRALLKLQAFDHLRPFCFLHGDYHLGNLYFDVDGRAGTLDWQSFAKGTWSHDVTYFPVSAPDIAMAALDCDTFELMEDICDG